jgi:hypothetical protein
MKLTFELKLKSIPVELANASGVPENYSLNEMTGVQRDEYLNDTASRMKFDPKGQAQGVKDFKGMQAKLISLCLTKGSGGAAVTVETINGWPATVVSALFKEAQKINALEAEKEEPAKNA